MDLKFGKCEISIGFIELSIIAIVLLGIFAR